MVEKGSLSPFFGESLRVMCLPAVGRVSKPRRG